MASFSLNYNAIKHVPEQLRKTKDDINRIQESVAQIRQEIDNSIREISIKNAVQNIQHIESHIMDEAAKMDTLAQALEKIIEYYCSTEKKAFSNVSLIDNDLQEYHNYSNTSYDDTSSPFSDFWARIRSLFVSLGIIKAEKQHRVDGEAVTKYQEKEMNRYMQNEINKILKKERFSRETWLHADTEERKSILAEYMQEVAAVMGLTVEGINFFYGESQNGYYTRGYYSDTQNTISINEWALENLDDSYSLMQTITHELRHAYQHMACENPDQFIVTEDTIEEWQHSFDTYKSQSKFMSEDHMNEKDAYEAYRNQAIEIDARKFAKQK